MLEVFIVDWWQVDSFYSYNVFHVEFLLLFLLLWLFVLQTILLFACLILWFCRFKCLLKQLVFLKTVLIEYSQVEFFVSVLVYLIRYCSHLGLPQGKELVFEIDTLSVLQLDLLHLQLGSFCVETGDSIQVYCSASHELLLLLACVLFVLQYSMCC